jgi:hypothetical protein
MRVIQVVREQLQYKVSDKNMSLYSNYTKKLRLLKQRQYITDNEIGEVLLFFFISWYPFWGFFYVRIPSDVRDGLQTSLPKTSSRVHTATFIFILNS